MNEGHTKCCHHCQEQQSNSCRKTSYVYTYIHTWYVCTLVWNFRSHAEGAYSSSLTRDSERCMHTYVCMYCMVTVASHQLRPISALVTDSMTPDTPCSSEMDQPYTHSRYVCTYVRRYHHYTFNHTEEILYTASTHLRIKEGNYKCTYKV